MKYRPNAWIERSETAIDLIAEMLDKANDGLSIEDFEELGLFENFNMDWAYDSYGGCSDEYYIDAYNSASEEELEEFEGLVDMDKPDDEDGEEWDEYRHEVGMLITDRRDQDYATEEFERETINPARDAILFMENNTKEFMRWLMLMASDRMHGRSTAWKVIEFLGLDENMPDEFIAWYEYGDEESKYQSMLAEFMARRERIELQEMIAMPAEQTKRKSRSI